MAIIYIISTVAFLVVFADKVPAAIEQILVSAFTPTAAAGGFLGATVLVAMRNGVAAASSPTNRVSAVHRLSLQLLKPNGRLNRASSP